MFGSLLLTVMLMTACASTNNGGVTDASSQSANTYDRVIEVANPVSLAHLVGRAPGVSLDFSRGIPKVRGRLPLYVVDGVRLGRNYYAAARSVNIHDVKSVQVLRRPSETLIYGREGSGGVIVINTF